MAPRKPLDVSAVCAACGKPGRCPNTPTESPAEAATESLTMFSEEALRRGWEGALALLEAKVGRDGVAKILADAARVCADAYPGKEPLMPGVWPADEVS